VFGNEALTETEPPRMIESLLAALSGSPGVALLAAFVWGVVSMLLSPCHLASIPLIVGFVDEHDGSMNGLRAFFISLLFSTGLFIAIALIGLVTAVLGRAIGDIGPYKSYLVAGVFFLVGLHLLGVVSLTWAKPQAAGVKGKGAMAALGLGLVFGIALGPCTFVFIAPLLAVALQVASTQLVYAVLLLVLYGIGHCGVIVIAGTFTGVIQRYLQWNAASKGTQWVKRACGILLLLAGLYMLSVA
jgi:cytochrome c-type biogenesis protein